MLQGYYNKLERFRGWELLSDEEPIFTAPGEEHWQSGPLW